MVVEGKQRALVGEMEGAEKVAWRRQGGVPVRVETQEGLLIRGRVYIYLWMNEGSQ